MGKENNSLRLINEVQKKFKVIINIGEDEWLHSPYSHFFIQRADFLLDENAVLGKGGFGTIYEGIY